MRGIEAMPIIRTSVLVPPTLFPAHVFGSTNAGKNMLLGITSFAET